MKYCDSEVGVPGGRLHAARVAAAPFQPEYPRTRSGRKPSRDPKRKPEGLLRAARVDSHGDHRIAMTACILGLVADGETDVEDADCIATSFPKFVGTLRALGADLEVGA